MMEINTPLIRKVLEHITANPWQWNQVVYSQQHSHVYAAMNAKKWKVPVTECGTAFCFAGHVAVMEGEDVHFDTNTVTDPDIGDIAHIADFAHRRLGLTVNQSARMFEADNSLTELWWLAALYTADTDDPIVVPEDLKS